MGEYEIAIKVASGIISIFLNLLSDDLGEKKNNFFAKIRIRRLQKNILKWVNKYIKLNDGTILTEGGFVSFFEYNKILEDIFLFSQDIDPKFTEEQFVKKLVDKTKNSIKCEISVSNEIVLRDFYKEILIKFKYYWINQLPDSLAVAIHQNAIQNAKVLNVVNELGDKCQKIINNSDNKLSENDVLAIFKDLNEKFWNGDFSILERIIPAIAGKSRDLELWIKVTLKIAKDIAPFYADLEMNSNIIIPELHDDIIRKNVLFSYLAGNTEFILSDANSQLLSEFAKDIKNQDHTKILEISKENKNHTELIGFKVSDYCKDEIWIAKRFLTIYLSRQPYRKVFEPMRNLFENDTDYVMDLILNEKLVVEMISSTNIDELKIKEILTNFWDKRNIYISSNCTIQKIFYSLCFKAAIYADKEKLIEIVSSIPNNLKSDVEIKEYLQMVNIEKGEADFDELIEICKASGKFWLINDYLISLKDPRQIVFVIEKEKQMLINNELIFFVYIQALRISGQKKKANDVLNDYADKYSEYTDYWIEKICVCEDEEPVLELESRWLSGRLKTVSPVGDDTVAEIMFKHKKIDSCLNIIKASETRGMKTFISQKLKAACLIEKERKIDAFNILKQLLPDHQNDTFVIINLLNLTLELKRPIDDMTIEAAIRIKSSYALLIVAKLYERDNKKIEAKKYIKQSLILNQGENEIVFGNYWISTIGGQASNFKFSGVDKDTAVYFKNLSTNKTIIYCVCDKELLPEEPYFWNDTLHISPEPAIKMAILRKKTGEIVNIETEDYEITEIIPLEHFYARLCCSKMVESGHAKTLQIPMSNDKEQNLKAFTELLKENLKETKKDLDVFENYKNFSEIPLTLYSLKQFSKLVYEQVVYNIIVNQNIMIRENFLYDRYESSITSNGYVLSYSTLVLLYKLGIKTELLLHSNVFIPKSMVIELQEEKENILDEYNRDTVASIGFIDDKLFVNESSESEKSNWMTLAVELLEFAKGISQLDNNNNVSTELISDSDIINLCGIVDYDAIALCKQNKYSFVNFEIVSEGIISLPDVNVTNCSILVFLQNIKQSDEQLLSCLIKMVQFRYLNVIDVTLLERFMNSEEIIEERWESFLVEVDKTRGKYRDILQNEFSVIGKNMIEKNIDVSNNIFRSFTSLVLKLNSIKFAFGINEDGDLEMATYVEPYEDIIE